MDNLKGLDVLAEMAVSVPTRIGVFVIHPVKMKNLKRFTALSAPLFNEIIAVFEGKSSIDELVVRHEQAVVELLTLCSGFTKEQSTHN